MAGGGGGLTDKGYTRLMSAGKLYALVGGGKSYAPFFPASGGRVVGGGGGSIGKRYSSFSKLALKEEVGYSTGGTAVEGRGNFTAYFSIAIRDFGVIKEKLWFKLPIDNNNRVPLFSGNTTPISPFSKSVYMKGSTCVGLDSILYSLGGSTAPDHHQPSKTVYCYDTAATATTAATADDWYRGTDMLLARDEPLAVVVDGKIYVIGGIDPSRDGDEDLEDDDFGRILVERFKSVAPHWAEFYDPKDETWRPVMVRRSDLDLDLNRGVNVKSSAEIPLISVLLQQCEDDDDVETLLHLSAAVRVMKRNRFEFMMFFPHACLVYNVREQSLKSVKMVGDLRRLLPHSPTVMINDMVYVVSEGRLYAVDGSLLDGGFDRVNNIPDDYELHLLAFRCDGLSSVDDDCAYNCLHFIWYDGNHYHTHGRRRPPLPGEFCLNFTTIQPSLYLNLPSTTESVTTTPIGWPIDGIVLRRG